MPATVRNSSIHMEDDSLPATTIMWMKRLAIAIGLFVWLAVTQQAMAEQESKLRVARGKCVAYTATHNGMPIMRYKCL